MTLDSLTFVDYEALGRELIAELRLRDTDPAFAAAPVLDVYARISKFAFAKDMPEQEREREKVPRQLYDTLMVVKARGARLGEVLSDNKKSAWKRDGKRPAFDRLLDRVECGQSSGCVVWRVDRLVRQPWDLERLIRLAETGRYTLVSTSGEFDFANRQHVQQLRYKVINANEESAEKSDRLRRKAEARRLVGDGDGRFNVFGHRYVHDRNPVSDAVLDAERDAVAYGYQCVVDGGSWCEVAREWNARGVTRRDGKRWTAQGVRQALVKPRHAGLLVHEGAIVHERLKDTQPIVSASLYRAMMTIVEGRRGRPKATGTHPLTAFARCEGCGRGLAGELHANRVYSDNAEPAWAQRWVGVPTRNYRCPIRGCNSNTIDARAIEEWARRETVLRLSDPKHAVAIARRSVALSKLDTSIASLQEKLTELADRLSSDRFTFADYDRLAKALNDRLELLDAQRAQLLAEGATDSGGPSDAAEVAKAWDNGTAAQRRQLAKAAMPYGINVAKADRSRRLRGEEIWTRLSVRKAP